MNESYLIDYLWISSYGDLRTRVLFSITGTLTFDLQYRGKST